MGMEIAAPRILIVDDKQEHGEAIARKLWKLGYASLFVQYDQEALLEGKYGPYQGVRLVFMDLDLAGEGRIGDGSRAYADVVATLKAILDSNNGPWVLVTWTRHVDHAETLFSHLKRRLPGELQPVSKEVMDKEMFINDGGTDRNHDLLSRLREIIRQENATGCLLGWEARVWKSANQVVADLSRTASSLEGEDTNKNLGHLLYELAKADAGETMEDSSEFAPPLYRVLTSLLSDKLSVLSPGINGSCDALAVSPIDGANHLAGWKREINSMINFEAGYSASTCPGALFEITDSTELPHPADGDVWTLIEKQFLFPKSTANDQQRKLVRQCSLYLLDITPPCDHFQKKIDWRRFVFVCMVPLGSLSNTQEKKLRKNYLNITPEFSFDGRECILVVNANLQISLCDGKLQECLGNASGRIKEQLMADILGWMGRHITRLGHVFLSTP